MSQVSLILTRAEPNMASQKLHVVSAQNLGQTVAPLFALSTALDLDSCRDSAETTQVVESFAAANGRSVSSVKSSHSAAALLLQGQARKCSIPTRCCLSALIRFTLSNRCRRADPQKARCS